MKTEKKLEIITEKIKKITEDKTRVIAHYNGNYILYSLPFHFLSYLTY